MSGKSKKDEMSIKESFEYLDDLLNKIQDEELPLEEAFALYEKGMKVLKECSEKIDAVEKKVKLIDANGNVSDLGTVHK
ncbi:MAG: exodeoxyribonuclease VII small subunit [Lachnospiraceae bacterium]|nr:exodeoxyribonuclease VII small subunit [Lachnospiraceae bacterium]